ncbi:MAG TPA: PAS domain S-box protein [Candidatus Methylacidiphilales bacterium]|nr:PAS domain S-box protein [Candidatus Methylacidiphilales bacterium]
MINEGGDFLLQNLLEHIPDAIYFKDRESRFILINQAAARLFKLQSPEEATGKTDFDIFTEEHAGAAFADEREIMRTGRPLVDKEEKETWPDGAVSWATTTKVPLRNKDGEIIGTFGISRNITERKQAIEQIAEQAALIDIAPDAIMVCDLQSNILFWNKGAESIYGWSREKVLGRTATDLLFSQEGSAKHDEALHEVAVLSQGSWKGEIHQVTKDGKELIIESNRILMRNAEGHPKSVLIINTDVTEKKKIVAQFMRAQRMESIGILSGGIAHDLNNILAPILMSIGLLRSSAKDSETKAIINLIESSAKRGAAIVKQVLSFARGVEGERTEIQVRHLLKEIERIIKNTLPKNIELEISGPRDLWTITGDLTQLQQVLLNLCVNARDAMPRGGLLKITAENRLLGQTETVMDPKAQAGPYILLNVIDSGTGIEPHLLDKIFEPFFTTKEVGKGTGLGLSTTLGIVKSHGGFIHVHSKLGKGSTFQIYLPAQAEAKAPENQTQTMGLPRGNGETILLVDDENSILAITSQALAAFGYNVKTASNGAQAVAIYTECQTKIAAIITDMAMPIMDGVSAIHAIKKINPDAKIIAASGLHDESSTAKAAAAGVKFFLHKPCATETLLKTLREILADPAEKQPAT